MKDGYRVFDSDMHVLEPADLWERYIDPAFRHRAPRGTTRTPMDVGVTVDGRDAFTLSAQIARVSFQGGLARFADDIARGFDARAQLTAMDREGIDVTVLYPSRGLFVHSISDLDPPSPRRSRAPTTIGWPTSAARAIPAGCTERPCCPSTTSRPRSEKRGARCATWAS